MRITRRAAAGAVPGVAALALAMAWAAPAGAAPAPQPTGAKAPAAAGPTVTFTPKDFEPGEKLTVTVNGCDGEPKTGFQAGSNEVFSENLEFGQNGTTWRAAGETKDDLKPGFTYETLLRCQIGDDSADFVLSVPVPVLPETTEVPVGPTESPDFEFDFDKVKLSTRTVKAGGEIGFEVTCPTSVTAESAAFTEAPEFTESDEEENLHTATATFKSSLPSVVTIKVTCKDYGSVTYSTQPGEDDIGNGGPTVPSGAPDTGDGSSLSSGGGTIMALGAGGLMLALFGGAGVGAAIVRRRSRAAENAEHA